jgi:hypothetical protein
MRDAPQSASSGVGDGIEWVRRLYSFGIPPAKGRTCLPKKTLYLRERKGNMTKRKTGLRDWQAGRRIRASTSGLAFAKTNGTE